MPRSARPINSNDCSSDYYIYTQLSILLSFAVAIDGWADVGTKMAEGSISLTYPVITQMTKDEQLYSNRYIVHSKFKGGKTWSTIDSFGPLGIHKFSLGSTPIKALL